jgi:hypothetical protein
MNIPTTGIDGALVEGKPFIVLGTQKLSTALNMGTYSGVLCPHIKTR